MILKLCQKETRNYVFNLCHESRSSRYHFALLSYTKASPNYHQNVPSHQRNATKTSAMLSRRAQCQLQSVESHQVALWHLRRNPRSGHVMLTAWPTYHVWRSLTGLPRDCVTACLGHTTPIIRWLRMEMMWSSPTKTVSRYADLRYFSFNPACLLQHSFLNSTSISHASLLAAPRADQLGTASYLIMSKAPPFFSVVWPFLNK